MANILHVTLRIEIDRETRSFAWKSSGAETDDDRMLLTRTIYKILELSKAKEEADATDPILH